MFGCHIRLSVCMWRSINDWIMCPIFMRCGVEDLYNTWWPYLNVVKIGTVTLYDLNEFLLIFFISLTDLVKIRYKNIHTLSSNNYLCKETWYSERCRRTFCRDVNQNLYHIFYIFFWCWKGLGTRHVNNSLLSNNI